MNRRPESTPATRSPASPQAKGEEALLVDRYRQLLRAAIARVVPHAIAYERDDVEQDACARLLAALRKGTAITNMESYVYRIGVTTAIDTLRRIKRRRETALDDAAELLRDQPQSSVGGGGGSAFSGEPSDNAHRGQQLEVARRAVGQLSTNRQAVVVLHLQGYTIDEVAAKLGWTEAKTRNLIYRGMAEIRKKCRAVWEERT